MTSTKPEPLVRESECRCYADIRGGRYERHEARELLKELAELVSKWDRPQTCNHFWSIPNPVSRTQVCLRCGDERYLP